MYCKCHRSRRCHEDKSYFSILLIANVLKIYLTVTTGCLRENDLSSLSARMFVKQSPCALVECTMLRVTASLKGHYPGFWPECGAVILGSFSRR